MNVAATSGGRIGIGRGWVLGGLFFLGVVAGAGLWLATPTVVAWRLESGLREAGFADVNVETRGFGWREVEVTEASGRTGQSELKVETATFSFTLLGLVLGRAKDVAVARLDFSYAGEEWPDWEDLEREFPILREERDPRDEPWAERIGVNEGRVRLRVAAEEAEVSFGLRLERADGGLSRGEVALSGAGLEALVSFEVDHRRAQGSWDIVEGRIVQDGRDLWADLLEVEMGREWELRGGPLRFSGQGEWGGGRWVWVGRGWFLDWVVAALKVDISLPSGFAEIEMVAEETAEGWDLRLDGELRVALVVEGEFEDLFELDASVTRLAGEWECFLRLAAPSAAGTMWFEVDLEAERGLVEVYSLVLDLDKVRAWVVLVFGAAAMEGWSVTGIPVELRGSGELAPGRFDWEVAGEMESAWVAGRGLSLVVASVVLDGAGAFIWRGEDWSLGAGVDLAAASVSYNDLLLRGLFGRWEGPPWDGIFQFKGTQLPQRLRVDGLYRVRRVEGDWELEGDTELDLTRRLP